MSGAARGGDDLLKRALSEIRTLRARVAELEARRPAVGIVGMAFRLPGGCDGAASLWRALSEGRDLTGEMPHARRGAGDGDWWSGEAAARGGYLEAVDGFDPLFFGISPREARGLDPQQRLLLELSWEALESAGVRPDRLRNSRTGVYVGLSTNDYEDAARAARGGEPQGYDGLGTLRSMAAGRISFALGLQGPALQLDTACSSSLVALHLGVRALRDGECDLAIVGGVNLVLSPESTRALARMNALSPSGRCRTFDAGADGMVRGEGCAVVVLERAPDAQAAGRQVLALVRGTAVNHDGPSSGLTVPNPTAQVRVIRSALRDAGVQPDAVDYVEAHGTGTSLGDPIELEALAEVFRGRSAPVAIGSVKTNVGHLEAAAGIGGLIKTVLALRAGALPPHLNLERPTGLVDWNALPLRVVTGLEPWPRRDGRPRIAGVSSFGMSGTNAHVVLEEAPAIPVDAPPPNPARDAHVVLVSARSESAVREQGRRWADWMESDGAGVPLREIGYTSHALRAAFEHRAFAVGGDAAEIAAALRELQPGPRVSTDPPRVAAVFPGQGAQHAGMAEALYQQSAIFRDAVARCSEAMRPELGFGIEEVLYGDLRERIGETEYAQPALYAVEWGLWELLRASGVKVGAVLGHSVGEYVAAAAAGWLDVEEGARWIVRRGRRMASCGGRGGMAAVIGERAEVERHLEPGIVVAAQNGPREVTISGEREALSRVVRRLESAGHGVRELRVSDGFHSACMEPMSREWADAVASMRIRPNPDGGVRLRSSVTGAWADEEMARGRYWAEQVMRPVEYWRGVRGLVEDGFGVVVEVGPDAALTGVGRRSGLADVRWIETQRRGEGGWRTLGRALGRLWEAGIDVDWSAWEGGWRGRGAPLPAYAFQRERYWIERAPQARIAAPSEVAARVQPALDARMDDPALRPYWDALHATEELTLSYVDAALARLGLHPGPCAAPGDADAAVPEPQHRFVHRLRGMLADARRAGRTPSTADPEARRRELLARHPDAATELELLGRCGAALVPVLAGDAQPLDALFPDGDLRLATAVYRDTPFARLMNRALADAVAEAVRGWPAGRELRVLEVGAGTGAATRSLLQALRDHRVRYTFTDVSPRFLSEARRTFHDVPGMELRLLDLESAPLAQGFAEGAYDLVVAANVVHATAEIRAALGRLRAVLAPHGLLVLQETTIPQRWVDLFAGFTGGWWTFRDHDLRPDHPLVPAGRWIGLLRDAGFADPAAVHARHGDSPAFAGPVVLLAGGGAAAEVRPAPGGAAAPARVPEPAASEAAPEGVHAGGPAPGAPGAPGELMGHLQDVLASVLDLSRAQLPDPYQGFWEVGMDSLTAVEFRARLERRLGHRLPSTLAFDYPNLAVLHGFLADELGLPGAAPGAASDADSQSDPGPGSVAVEGVAASVPAQAAGLEDELMAELARVHALTRRTR